MLIPVIKLNQVQGGFWRKKDLQFILFKKSDNNSEAGNYSEYQPPLHHRVTRQLKIIILLIIIRHSIRCRYPNDSQIRQPISDQVWDNHQSGRWKFLVVRQTPGQQTWFCSASSFCAASRQLQIVPRFTFIAIIAQAAPGWLQKCQHSVQWGGLRQDGCRYVIRQLFGETLGYLLDALRQKLCQDDLVIEFSICDFEKLSEELHQIGTDSLELSNMK